MTAFAEHEWALPRWAGGTTVLYVCKRCGIVRRADGLNRPCRDDVRVSLQMRRP